MLSLRGAGEGEREQDSSLVKGDVVTSGLCWLKNIPEGRTGNKPAEKSRGD